jgi:hypothetical protein
MKPSEYKHIRAWGAMMHSFEYYISDQQERAAQDNAPLDAIFKDHDDGHWHTYSGVDNQDTRYIMDQLLTQMGVAKEELHGTEEA